MCVVARACETHPLFFPLRRAVSRVSAKTCVFSTRFFGCSTALFVSNRHHAVQRRPLGPEGCGGERERWTEHHTVAVSGLSDVLWCRLVSRGDWFGYMRHASTESNGVARCRCMRHAHVVRPVIRDVGRALPDAPDCHPRRLRPVPIPPPIECCSSVLPRSQCVCECPSFFRVLHGVRVLPTVCFVIDFVLPGLSFDNSCASTYTCLVLVRSARLGREREGLTTRPIPRKCFVQETQVSAAFSTMASTGLLSPHHPTASHTLMPLVIVNAHTFTNLRDAPTSRCFRFGYHVCGFLRASLSALRSSAQNFVAPCRGALRLGAWEPHPAGGLTQLSAKATRRCLRIFDFNELLDQLPVAATETATQETC